MASMSDFDFDELDKAVAGATANPAEEVLDTLDEPSRPAVAEVAPTPVMNEAPKIAPAARRASGRFMDVVHPSSDMRSRTTPAVLSTATVKKETTSFVPPVAKPQEAPAEAMDFEENGSSVGEWSKPLETPFLADAKVEKRPLGGVGPEPSLVLLNTPEDELLLEAPDDPRIEATALPDPIDFAAHIASLESEKEDTGSEAQQAAEASEQTIEQLDELEKTEPVMPPALEVKTTPEPAGPTSITQQYTEQPTTQQESGAIFDTENYHQPLAPAAKKHSSVLAIIGIIVLVLLGAGAGVAFYWFVLPNL